MNSFFLTKNCTCISWYTYACNLCKYVNPKYSNYSICIREVFCTASYSTWINKNFVPRDRWRTVVKFLLKRRTVNMTQFNHQRIDIRRISILNTVFRDCNLTQWKEYSYIVQFFFLITSAQYKQGNTSFIVIIRYTCNVRTFFFHITVRVPFRFRSYLTLHFIRLQTMHFSFFFFLWL